MKKNNYKNQLKVINASRGMECRDVLYNGGIWTRPTMCMETKKYDRSRQKLELRKYSEY